MLNARDRTQYYFNASTGTDNGNCTSSSSPCRTISQANALTYPNGATINLAGGTTFSGTTLTLTTSNARDTRAADSVASRSAYPSEQRSECARGKSGILACVPAPAPASALLHARLF